MYLSEFAKMCRTKFGIEVRSGYNDKLLCKAFREDKHGKIAGREVVMFWPDIRAKDGYARAVMCVYVHGDVEYQEDHREDG